MTSYPETPDNWIERREEHAPPEGAMWCSDCGEWIEEPCVHQVEFKYEVGQRVSRFGEKVTIASREISALGNPTYQIEQIYMGNRVTTSAREDELSIK